MTPMPLTHVLLAFTFILTLTLAVAGVLILTFRLAARFLVLVFASAGVGTAIHPIISILIRIPCGFPVFLSVVVPGPSRTLRHPATKGFLDVRQT